MMNESSEGAMRLSFISTVSILIILLPLSSCENHSNGGEGTDLEKVRKAIDEGNSHWIEAFNKADATLLASLFLDDGMILGNDGGISRGRKAIQERMEEVMHGIGPASATVSTTNLWVIGDTAYETGEYAYSVHVEGKNTVISSGKYVVVWKRTTNGSWKIYVDIGMPND